jgi:hypothetical protein
MKNEYQELKRMRDDTSNSVFLREIALLSEKNDELRVTIAKLKKGGEIRVENERLKLTIKKLNIQLKDSENYINEIIRKEGEWETGYPSYNKRKRDYMCVNCGGGFSYKEMFFDDGNADFCKDCEPERDSK